MPRPAPLGLLLVPLLATHAAAGVDTTAPAFVVEPVIRENPVRWVPLSALIDLETDEPTRVVLGIDDGVTSRRVIAVREPALVHEVPVLGMKAGRTHAIDVFVKDAAGNETRGASTLVFDTPPLPADFPPLVVHTSLPTRMEPGVTLFATRYSTPGGGARGNWAIMLDKTGEVVWFYRNPFETPSNMEVLRNGNLFFQSNRTALEVDRLGRVVGKWFPAAWSTVGMPADAVQVDTDTFHHELHELPESADADFIALSAELRVLSNYPADEVDPTQVQANARVVGDVIVEFDRDGTIVRQASLLDVLDPYRMCYGSLGDFWDGLYGAGTHDWSHGNAVTLDPTDNTWIVSLRHQDCVVKIDRATGQLVWILGAHERWAPAWQPYLLTPIGAPFGWSYHQHAPELNRVGRIVMFDNGNYRVIPPAVAAPPEQWYSRAVEYDVDANAGTVRQTWVYGGPHTTWFSGFLGDADPLPRTGNVLVTDGAKPAFGLNTTYARIVEVSHTRPPMPVFEVELRDPANALNWTIYRSERVAGVYPE